MVGYSKNDQILGLVLAFSESSLDYNVKHPGNIAQGICGVTPSWNDFLRERQIPKNSIKACIEIYNHLLSEHDYNHRKALKNYKGIKSKRNMWIVDKVLKTKQLVKAQQP